MKTNETGHAKNVANFDELISSVTGFGTTYNPSKASIKLIALQTLATNAKNSVTAVNAALPAYTSAVAAREAAFEPLSKLVTRVYSALKATDVTEQLEGGVLTFVRKIQGRRASKKLNTTEKKILIERGETLPDISASQMSYDNRLDNFDKLIKLLTSVTLYAPNEADLKVTALTTLYNDLKAKNTAVINAATPLSNARIARNDVLYKEITGMVSIVAAVKAYIKSLFGATSPQYKQISSLKYTTPR